MKLFSIDSLLPGKGIHNQLMDMLVEVQSQDSPRTVEDLSNAILDMLKSLKDNQAKHEEINKKMMAQCLDEENFRRKEVADAQSAYNAASSAFAKCQSSLKAAQDNLPSLKRALTEFEANLASKTAERNKQHSLYLTRRADWQEAIGFLGEFINQVNNKLAKYPSFADLGEKLLRHVAKLGRMTEAVEVFVALAQEPSESVSGPGAHSNYNYKSQAKTVNTLKDHLRTLLNKLTVDSKQNDTDEAKSQAAFEKVKAELLAIIGKLRTDITRTNTQITNMSACVANEGKIMTTAGNKLSRNKKLGSLAGQTCTDFTREFISATKNRLGEMDVIHQILAIMKKRFGQLPEDLTSYLRATRMGFRAYINSTQFIKYQEYVQSHVADNVTGKGLVAITK
jgi:DNA repair exonuclease SbcCD ATPase subunit